MVMTAVETAEQYLAECKESECLPEADGREPEDLWHKPVPEQHYDQTKYSTEADKCKWDEDDMFL